LDFDGRTEDLVLPWSPERLALIERSEVDPNEVLLRQWRQAMCHKLANGSDWCWIAWIVPLWIDGNIQSYGLFTFDSFGSDDDPPIFKGVFSNTDEAMAALSTEGAIAGSN